MSPRTEQELLDATIDLARMSRWATTHFRAAMTRKGYRTAIQGNPGWPDLALARGGVLLLRELKGARGRLSSEQQDWAQQLLPGWVESPTTDWGLRRAWLFDVWRPQDWPLIVELLTARESRRSA